MPGNEQEEAAALVPDNNVAVSVHFRIEGAKTGD